MSQLQFAPPRSPQGNSPSKNIQNNNNSVTSGNNNNDETLIITTSTTSTNPGTPPPPPSTTTTIDAETTLINHNNTIVPANNNNNTTSTTTISPPSNVVISRQQPQQQQTSGAYFIPATVPFQFPVGHPLRRLSLLSPDAQIGFKISFPNLVNKNETNTSTNTTSLTSSVFQSLRYSEHPENNNNNHYYVGTTSLPTTPPLAAQNQNEQQVHQDPTNTTSSISGAMIPPFSTATNNNNTNNNEQFRALSFDSNYFQTSPPQSSESTASPTPNTLLPPFQQPTTMANKKENTLPSSNQQPNTNNRNYWLSEFQRLFLDAPNKIEPASFTSDKPFSSKARDEDFLKYAIEQLSQEDLSVSSIQHWYLAARFTNDLDLMIQILKCKTITEALEFLKKQEEISAKRKAQELDEELNFEELMKLGKETSSSEDDDDDSSSDDEDGSSGRRRKQKSYKEATSDLLFGLGPPPSASTPASVSTTSNTANNNNNLLLSLTPATTTTTTTADASPLKKSTHHNHHHRIIPIERDSRWSSPSHRRRVFRFGLWCAFVGSGILLPFHENVQEEDKQRKQDDEDDKKEAALVASITEDGTKKMRKADRLQQQQREKEREKMKNDRPPTETYVPLHIQFLIETQGHPLFLRSKPIWNNRQEEEEGSFSSSWTSWYGEDLSLLRDYDIARLLPSAFQDEKFFAGSVSISTTTATTNTVNNLNLNGTANATTTTTTSRSSPSAGQSLANSATKSTVSRPKLLDTTATQEEQDEDSNNNNNNFAVNEIDLIEEYVHTRPLVSLPMIFLLSTSEKEDYVVPATSNATRIADSLLPPSKVLAMKIRARLFSEKQHQQNGSNSNRESPTSAKTNNNTSSPGTVVAQQQQHHFDDLDLISDHLPSALNILKGLFRNTTNLLLYFDTNTTCTSNNTNNNTVVNPHSPRTISSSHNNNNNSTSLLPTTSSSIITPSFIYSLLLDCYSSPAAARALEVLLATDGKRLVVLGSDPLLADGGHLENTGFAEAEETTMNLVSMTTDEITKEMQNRRGLCRGGNLLGRILEVVRQDFMAKEQQQQQQAAASSTSPTTTTAASAPTSSSSHHHHHSHSHSHSHGHSHHISTSFLARAAPKISRRRLDNAAFNTKLLLRSHAFEFKLQNLCALLRPLDVWWTQQLGAFCGLKPAALSHQLSTFSRALTEHEEEQELLSSNNSFGKPTTTASSSAPAQHQNTSESSSSEKKKLTLDMMISAAASSSRGPVCCALCVSVPIPLEKKLKKKLRKLSNNNNNAKKSEEHQDFTSKSLQEQEEIVIREQLRAWETSLRAEQNYSNLPSWCYAAELDDIVITTPPNKTNHNDMFLDVLPPLVNGPPSSAATGGEETMMPQITNFSLVENSSYFTLAQTHQDNYNASAQSQEFFASKKSNELMMLENDDASTSSPSPSSNNPVFDATPTPPTTTKSTNEMKLATFVFYVRFDSFDNHSLDQMNLESHLFAFNLVQDDITGKKKKKSDSKNENDTTTTLGDKNAVKTDENSSSSSSIFTIQVQNNIRARTLSNGVRLRVFFGPLSYQRIADRLKTAKKQENALMCALMTIPSREEQEEQEKKIQEYNTNTTNKQQSTSSSNPTNNNNSKSITVSSSSSKGNSATTTPASLAQPSKKGGSEMVGAKMSKLLSFLYLGSANDASSSAILKEGITHVLNASHVRVYSPSNSLLTNFLGIPDVGDRTLFDIKSIFPVAFNFIDSVQKMHDEAMSAIVSGGGEVVAASSSSAGATSSLTSTSGATSTTTTSVSLGATSSLFTVTRTNQGSGTAAIASPITAVAASATSSSAVGGTSSATAGGSSPSAAAAASSSTTTTTVVPKILVHCEKGKSRSAAIVTAYLMRLNGWTVSEALHYIRQRRPFVEPNLGFIESLKEYEKEIAADRAVKRRALAVLLRNPAQSLSKVQIHKAMQLLGVEEVVDCSDRIASDGTRRLVTQFASPGGANRAIVAARALSAKMLALGGRVWLTDFDEYLHAIKTGRS